jgi:hypothetical protein
MQRRNNDEEAPPKMLGFHNVPQLLPRQKLMENDPDAF